MAVSDDAFWGSNYYKHPPLDDAAVAEAERQLDIKLPAEYLRLLRIQNGGYTQGLAFPTDRPTSYAGDHAPFFAMNGIVLDMSLRTMLNVLETEYITNEWGLPPQQALLVGKGRWWISLDYRNGPTPSVAWIDVENEEDFQLAPTFAAFLNGLVPKT